MSNGRLLYDPPVAVDFWSQSACGVARFFFLTHMHTDHIFGLKPTWRNVIFCSSITKRLLVHRLKLNKKQIRELDVGSRKLLSYTDSQGITKKFSVTAYDANHCPGAIMLLFDSEFGRILYTGDFRFDELMRSRISHLKGTVNHVYIDNTYCDPKCLFPPREQAERQVLNLIADHPNHDIILVLSLLGRENLLVNISQSFREWIIVEEDRMAQLKLMNFPCVFSTNVSDGRIFVCTWKTLHETLRADHVGTRQLIICPSSMFNRNDDVMQGLDVNFVPYSDHSSFMDLMCFVELISPERVTPLVKKYKGYNKPEAHARTDMRVFSSLLTKCGNIIQPAPGYDSQALASGDGNANATDESIMDYFSNVPLQGSKVKDVQHFRKERKRKRSMPTGVIFDSDENNEANEKTIELFANKNALPERFGKATSYEIRICKKKAKSSSGEELTAESRLLGCGSIMKQPDRSDNSIGFCRSAPNKYSKGNRLCAVSSIPITSNNLSIAQNAELLAVKEDELSSSSSKQCISRRVESNVYGKSCQFAREYLQELFNENIETDSDM